jgi:predicted small lipoprotein YifL
MTGIARFAIGAAVVAAIAAAAAGCGQQGPLVLPENARPLERVEPPAGEPEQPDDEQRDEQ